MIAPTAIAPFNEGNPERVVNNIFSSKEDSEDYWRWDRRLFNRDVVTHTVTMTMYAFSPTSIKKTITPVKEIGKLLCVPPGVVVC